jgi:hypothetical protein
MRLTARGLGFQGSGKGKVGRSIPAVYSKAPRALVEARGIVCGWYEDYCP